MTDIDSFKDEALNAMQTSVDNYVNSMCERLGLTPEQMAELYTLQWEPVEARYAQVDDDFIKDTVRMQVRQVVRLVRREE